MLSRTSRLTSPTDFQTALRRGRRAGSGSLVVHLSCPDPGTGAGGEPARVGLVVSRAVGGAVARNQVKRRLRHLVREHLDELPPGSLLVVRALPPAATAPYAELGEELARGLGRVTRTGARR